MSKKAILALMIAILIPAVSYILLKTASDHAVVMPRKYLLDSVVTVVKNGKQEDDSIWHVT